MRREPEYVQMMRDNVEAAKKEISRLREALDRERNATADVVSKCVLDVNARIAAERERDAALAALGETQNELESVRASRLEEVIAYQAMVEGLLEHVRRLASRR